jgi:hypothetical protein
MEVKKKMRRTPFIYGSTLKHSIANNRMLEPVSYEKW